jgi:hypothetical protein
MATTKKTPAKARAAKSNAAAPKRRASDQKTAESAVNGGPKSFGKRTAPVHAAVAARKTGPKEASLAGKAVKMAVSVGETAVGAIVAAASLVKRSPRGKSTVKG